MHELLSACVCDMKPIQLSYLGKLCLTETLYLQSHVSMWSPKKSDFLVDKLISKRTQARNKRFCLKIDSYKHKGNLILDLPRF